MTDKTVRWGIISTAHIGMGMVTPAIMKSAHSEVTAISSRDIDSARTAAAKLGIEKAYGSYDEMLADPDIDAVYNPLPNHLHVELSLAAARAGKHVLCEKPMGMNAGDVERLKQAPGGILIAEAFMVRWHPQWLRAREIIRSGEIGEVRAVNAVFSYYNVDPDNVRNKADIGGGGIMDIGCYPVTAGRFFLEGEPRRIVSLVDRDPNFRTDRLASVLADFGEGRQLAFTVSTQAAPNQRFEIVGTRARIEIVIPVNPPADAATALLIDHGHTLDGSLARREILPPCDHYTEQAEVFALAVLGENTLPYGVDDAIASMKVLDAIFESEKTGGWAII